jgi:hypothetical protein
MLFRRYGHDYLTASRLDRAGVTYISICSIWTLLLIVGLTIFLCHRKVDFIRMRNPLLVSSGLLLIHVYLCLVLLLYPLNASYGCDAGFWVMSVYFPLGITVWHTANIQVLNLSSLQGKLAVICCSQNAEKHQRHIGGWKAWLQQTSIVTRTSIAVVLCSCLQVGLCYQ